MPIYDYECQVCGNVFEYICKANHKPRWLYCRICHETAKPIISANGVYTGNQDADWIKSVREVVGDETQEGRTFKANPTRANYTAWMKRKGLRPYEPGEPTRPPPPDDRAIQREVVKRHFKRKRIEIKG
jgi:putative FmdB family regulatory protein